MFTRSLVSRFLSEEGGNFALVFGLTLPLLAGSAAVAVETSNVFRERAILQYAADASALATGKLLSQTRDQTELQTYARNFFYANIKGRMNTGNTTLALSLVKSDDDIVKGVRINVDYRYPTYLAPILKVYHFDMDIVSEISAGNRSIEVAIVVDNSGSMDSSTGGTSESRLEKATAAAKQLATQLHSVGAMSTKADPVKISVVPFAASVNIGSGNRGETWMDMNGWSSIHHENIAWDAASKRGDSWGGLLETGGGYKGIKGYSQDETGTEVDWLTRWTLFDAIDVAWAGCVEMRPWPYNTTDDEPDSMDADTLYVPMFAPDEPNEKGSNEDDDYSNNYLDDYDRNSSSGTYSFGTYVSGVGYNYGTYTRQHNRQWWSMKYNSESAYSRLGTKKSRDYGYYGPNLMCTTTAITPLTTNLTTVNDAIDAMEAGGYTNVQAGIAWGWRTLSAAEPFTAGRGYDEYENDKYIIVLTDGNNTYPNQSTYNDSQYSAWGYEKDGRVFEGLTESMGLVEAMNTHTQTTCANIKAIQDADEEPAYTIFTIAYDVPDGSSVKDVLYDCASEGKNGKRYYYDVQGDAIAGAMQAIGTEISQLRLSK
jgi:hypothetical protein